MVHPYWVDVLLACLRGSPRTTSERQPTTERGAERPVVPQKDAKYIHSSENTPLDVVPLFWSYLSKSDRLSLRLSCREGRRIHDSLVTKICICENAFVGAVLSDRHLRHASPPRLEIAAADAEVSTALHGIIARGCRPHLLALCLDSGNEHRRQERGLAFFVPLASAPGELASIHLGGVPLSSRTLRALQPLLAPAATTSAAPLGSTNTPTAAHPGVPYVQASIAPPLRLHLYGYDLTKPATAAALAALVAAAGPRLEQLELRGCLGWPKLLPAKLQTAVHLRHLTLSFQPIGASAGTAARSGGGLVTAFHPAAAAASAAAAMQSLGLLRQLTCLELRGTVVKGTETKVVSSSKYDTSAAAGPSPQSLARALYQLTALTRLAVEGLASTEPLLTSFTAMRALRDLELPDTSVNPEGMEALARAAPDLTALTLGSVGLGPVLTLRDARQRAAATAAQPLEALALPSGLNSLAVVRNRVTLRTMRSLGLALEARRTAAARRALVVVPGIEIDLPDVEFDPLQAFHMCEDSVMRSYLLPEPAAALVAALRMLAATQASPPASGAAAAAVTAADGGREFAVHNENGSLTAAPSGRTAALAAAAAPAGIDSGEDGDRGVVACDGASSSMGSSGQQVGGHAVWISEMQPLRLAALELYGVGLMSYDLAAVAGLTTLRRLSLASGELAVHSLSRLAALPLLQHLELLRCTTAPASSDTAATAGAVDASAAEMGGDTAADDGRRALLELCMRAPRLRRVQVVRSAGTDGACGRYGPFGVEWVRERLQALGSRRQWWRQRARVGEELGEGLWIGGREEEVEDEWPEVSWN
ncbi:hypothetical protein Agub_g3140 [Astrephomene gubernaculifera]|uniref:Uncharacterized protein n=1 Tax=Astrephomene gubernaculifera TaxID=47775 RepID=A0AAD3HIX0_9CHLO|nr:hypothetical protein Agub_g3140 [Astrephomene gubernaculifera]